MLGAFHSHNRNSIPPKKAQIMITGSVLPILNRQLIIIRPKEPYLNWIRNLPAPDDEALHDLSLSSIDKDPSVFLIPSDCDPTDAVEHYLPYIWHEMLSAWYTDESLWSKKLSLKEFNRWFKVETASMVFDLPNRDVLDYDESV